MKKSIKILVITLLTISSAVSASNIKTDLIELNSSTNFKKSEDIGVKFVSYADASQLESEIASLKKYSKNIDETIADDTKIIEAANPVATKKVSAKKKTLKLKKTFRN